MASSLLMCFLSSSSVIPPRASSVVMASCLADTRSRDGSGGPLRAAAAAVEEEEEDFASREEGLVVEGLRFPWESTEVVEALLPLARTRERERDPDGVSVEVRREPVEETRWRSEGRTSFFCLDAGRISSRSTGTPRETRKRRRMRERIQSGGWRGGGATSWDQREAERGVRKMGFVSREGAGRGRRGGDSFEGKRESR